TFFDKPPGIARAQALLESSLFRDRATLTRDSLFEDGAATQAADLRVQPFTRLDLSRMEQEHLGFMVSGHPLDFARIPPNIVSASDIRSHAGETVRMVGWGIAAKVLATKNSGRTMKMLTLEDHSGTYEATMFP